MKWKRLPCSVLDSSALSPRRLPGQGTGRAARRALLPFTQTSWKPRPLPSSALGPPFSFPLNGQRSSKASGRLPSDFQQGVGWGSFTKHCSITALPPEAIFTCSSGSCPLNTSGFGFAFNARSILSELSPTKWRADIPLPQEYLKSSVFT